MLKNKKTFSNSIINSIFLVSAVFLMILFFFNTTNDVYAQEIEDNACVPDGPVDEGCFDNAICDGNGDGNSDCSGGLACIALCMEPGYNPDINNCPYTCDGPVCEPCVPGGTSTPSASFGIPPYTITVTPRTESGVPSCTDGWEIQVLEDSDALPVIAEGSVIINEDYFNGEDSWSHTFSSDPGSVLVRVRPFGGCPLIYGEWVYIDMTDPGAIPPICDSFDVLPVSVEEGEEVQVSWTSTGATSGQVFANSTPVYSIPVPDLNNGQATLLPITNPTTYNATFTNDDGSVQCTAIEVEVTDGPPPPSNIHGGIGWISFNCEDTGVCATSDYKVFLDTSNGNLSGYAWANPKDEIGNSDSFGWISFNSTEYGTCPEGPCQPNVNLTTGEVTGWIRDCSVFQLGCSGLMKGNVSTGGWDGWIRLSGQTSPFAYPGVSYDVSTGSFSGFAWGGPSIGWISFNPQEDLGYLGASFPGVSAQCEVTPISFELYANNISVPVGSENIPHYVGRTLLEGGPESIELTNVSVLPPLDSTYEVTVELLGTSEENSCTPTLGEDCSTHVLISVTESGGASRIQKFVESFVNFVLGKTVSASSHFEVTITGVSDSGVQEQVTFSVLPVSGPSGPQGCTGTPANQVVNLPVTWTETSSFNDPVFWYHETGELMTCTQGQPSESCQIVYSTVGEKSAFMKEAEEVCDTEGCEWVETGADIDCSPAVNVVVLPVFEQF